MAQPCTCRQATGDWPVCECHESMLGLSYISRLTVIYPWVLGRWYSKARNERHACIPLEVSPSSRLIFMSMSLQPTFCRLDLHIAIRLVFLSISLVSALKWSMKNKFLNLKTLCRTLFQCFKFSLLVYMLKTICIFMSNSVMSQWDQMQHHGWFVHKSLLNSSSFQKTIILIVCVLL